MIDGEEYDFGVSGKLIRNVLVMYDRQTNSLWSQLLGEAVEGPLVGSSLTFLPSWMMSWGEWKERFPDTLALDKRGQRGSRDRYASYYASNQTGVIGETFNDSRLYVKEFVVGVSEGEEAVAYPFSGLNDLPVINDTIDGRPIAVVFDQDKGTAVVYDRTIEGQVLTFEERSTPGTMVDEETATVWDMFSGLALEGTLSGEKLERVRSTTSFWFGWKDFHPDTRVYEVAPSP